MLSDAIPRLNSMLRPLQKLVSALTPWMERRANKAAFGAAPKPTAFSPRPLTPADPIIAITRDEYREPIEDVDMPPIIANNPLWRRISPLAKSMCILYDHETVSALLVKLCDSEIQLVIKTWPAERATNSWPQVQAELDAAKSFAWHPLMATLVAACFDKDGNFCSVMPYAGCSLRSILDHSNWFTAVSAQERLDFARQAVHHSLMVFDIMQHTGVGHYHRDIKPDNMCVNPITGLVSVIDYGLKVWANMENFIPGYTPGYCAPELVNLAAIGGYRTYCIQETLLSQVKAITETTDVFLICFVGLETAVGLRGLPWQLLAEQHDVHNEAGSSALLREHAAAAAAGYGALIARVPCPVAQDFFRRTMCSDPAQRPTPAEALKHEWLAGSRAAVEQAVAAAMPAYQQQNQQIAELFAGVPGVILPQQQPQKLSAAPSVCSATVDGDSLHDVARSPELSSCSEHSNSLATSSVCSNSLVGDTAADDQLQAALVTAAVAAAKKKASLLQRGKKLLSKLSKRSMNLTSDKSCDSNGAPQSAGIDAAGDKEQGAEAITIVAEPCAVSVPGWCGIRWCWKNKRST